MTNTTNITGIVRFTTKTASGVRVLNRREYGVKHSMRGAALKKAHRAYLKTAMAADKAVIAADANLILVRKSENAKSVTVRYAKADAMAAVTVTKKEVLATLADREARIAALEAKLDALIAGSAESVLKSA